jgi:hypothetical protein
VVAVPAANLRGDVFVPARLFWAHGRDDRPFGGADPPIAVYVYAQNRKSKQPIAHLAGFCGVLQVDGYAGYRALAEKNSVQLAFSWAHVGKCIYELAVAGPVPIASESLERIGQLYAIEREIRGRCAEERRDTRQERSRPILGELEVWLCEKLPPISQRTKLARRFAMHSHDGMASPALSTRGNSNVVERAIRPIARNRKNVLFAGSDGGNQNCRSVKRNGLFFRLSHKDSVRECETFSLPTALDCCT